MTAEAQLHAEAPFGFISAKKAGRITSTAFVSRIRHLLAGAARSLGHIDPTHRAFSFLPSVMPRAAAAAGEGRKSYEFDRARQATDTGDASGVVGATHRRTIGNTSRSSLPKLSAQRRFRRSPRSKSRQPLYKRARCGGFARSPAKIFRLGSFHAADRRVSQ